MSLKDTYAYQMGLDCGKNGPNEKNCHFSIFSKREYTDAWEKGKADAEAEKRTVSKIPAS